MKIFFIIFLLLTCVYRLSAQDFLKQPFLEMTLNDITMAELFEDNIDWNFFKSKFGTPISETLKDYDREYKEKKFIYSGAQFRFSDYLGPYMFREASIESSNFVFLYDKTEIKVGNQIENLAQKFPNQYSTRNGGRMIIYHEFADIIMVLKYNSAGIISKIVLSQSML